VLRLINKDKKSCVIQLTSEKAAKRWQSEVIHVGKFIQEQTEARKRPAIADAQSEVDNSMSIDEGQFHDASEAINEKILLQFEFSAPKICLQLDTPKIDGSEWSLVTNLSNISVNLNKHEHDMKIYMSVATLTVKDNSNDERYPFIFKNEPNDG